MNTLKHYGVQGQKWGIRRPLGPDGLIIGSRKSLKKLSRKIKRNLNTRKRNKQRLEKIKEEALKKKIAAFKNPKDMTDEELKDYHTRLSAKRKLQTIAKSKSLDDMSIGLAKDLVRNSDSKSSAELKKEADRLENRSRQLEESRPSYGKKPGIGYTLLKTSIKTGIDAGAAKGFDAVLGYTMDKNGSVGGGGTRGGGRKRKSTSGQNDGDNPSKKQKNIKDGIAYKTVTNTLKGKKNNFVDSKIDEIWAKRYDKKRGFK